MLTIYGGQLQTCEGLSRRKLVQAAGAGLFGLSLPKLLACQSQAKADGFAKIPGRAKHVIFLFLFGGPSQLETFDLKPNAPDAIRGPFRPIACRTPDLLISEALPKLAACSDKYAVLRTISHDFNDHSGGGHYIQTGRRWHIPIGGGFNATPKDAPSMGSLVAHFDALSRRQPRELPPYMVLPNYLGRLQDDLPLKRPGEYAGWLGRARDPLNTVIDKRAKGDNPYFRPCEDSELQFQIEGLCSQQELSIDRLARRQSLLQDFDDALSRAESDNSAQLYDDFTQQAFGLVASQRTRQALDLTQEDALTRDRYGRHLFGQSTLLARRLVEAGVQFVTVHWDCPDGYSWDSHIHSKDVKDHLLPGFDQAMSALLEDLSARGLLEETLVIAMGEMGRTPQATPDWGRNHWSMLFPAILAGSGIRGGTVHGSSDKNAAYARETPVSPEDLQATVLHAMGIPPETRLIDPTGRPMAVSDGNVLNHLFG